MLYGVGLVSAMSRRGMSAVRVQDDCLLGPLDVRICLMYDYDCCPYLF